MKGAALERGGCVFLDDVVERVLRVGVRLKGALTRVTELAVVGLADSENQKASAVVGERHQVLRDLRSLRLLLEVDPVLAVDSHLLAGVGDQIGGLLLECLLVVGSHRNTVAKLSAQLQLGDLVRTWSNQRSGRRCGGAVAGSSAPGSLQEGM